MQRYNGQLINQFASIINGNAAAGALVTVKLKSTGATVTLYAEDDLGGATLANPLTADAKGYYGFYAPDGVYTLDVSISGTPQLEIQLGDIAALQAQFDAALANAGYIPVGTFAAGCTVSQSNGAVSDGSSFWRWDGALPKTVTAGSAPTPTGAGNWILISDGGLRDELADANSTVEIAGTEAAEVVDNASDAWKKVSASESGSISKKAVVSFIFDDGFVSALTSVAPMFEARGITCGFSIPFRLIGASADYMTRAQLIELHSRGFEIGNHTLNNTQLTTSTPDAATGEAEIVGGYKELVAMGLDPKFFVAVSSALDNKFNQYVRLNHEFSFPRGTAGIGASGIQDTPIDRYNLKRESLFSIGVAGAKTTIDYVKANGGYAQFYDHDPLQVGFPSSLSAAQVAEILDYAIAQGVDIQPPSKAVDLFCADLIKGRDVVIDSVASKSTLASSGNLIVDSEFTSFGQSNGTLTPLTAWIVENTGSGTVTPSRIGKSAGALSVLIGADTSVGNTITIKNESVRFDAASSRWRNSTLCFAVDAAGINNNFETNYTSVVGIQLRKTSDSTVIAESVINVDLFPFMRTIYATLPTPTATDFYVTCFVRVTVVTPLATTLIIAKPVVSLTTEPAPYQSAPDRTSRITPDPLRWRMNSTAIPTGFRTTIPITTGSVQNDIGRFDSGSFYAYQKGLYRVDWVNVITTGGVSAGSRVIVGINKNGANDHEFEDIGQGTGRNVIKMSSTIYLNPLDYISAYIAQYSGSTVTTDGGDTCPFRVTYLGQ